MPKHHSHAAASTVTFTPTVIKRGLWMWGLASLFYFYDYLLQVSPGAMKPELFEAFSLTAVQFGSISALFHYAYGSMQIPAGMLLDQWGPRRILTLACVLSALGCFWFGWAEQGWEAQLSRLLMGLGASFALMGCFKIASIWFPPNHFAFVTGCTVTIGFLGGFFGLSMVSEIIKVVHWRESLRIGAWVGFLGAIALFLVVRDKRTRNGEPASDTHLHLPQIWQGLKRVCSQKNDWFASIYSGLMFSPTLAFSLWGVPFLVEAHHFDRHTAGQLSSVIYIGWIIGAPFYGWLSDKMGSRTKPMVYATVLNLITCISLIYLTHLPVMLIGSLLFLMGFFSSGFILAFVIVRENHPVSVTGTAMGFINTLNSLIGAISQPLIGMFLEKFSGEPTYNDLNERIFSLPDYQNALSLLIVALVLSLILLFQIKDTHPKKVA